MGNKCCRQQDDGGLISSDRPFEMEERGTTYLGAVTNNDLQPDAINPQSKLDEYYRILQDMQLDNLKKMREQLKKQPDIFLLNNLILSIQFFDNFDRAKENMRLRKLEQESAVNNSLGDIRRGCHYEGALTEIVGQDYRYQSQGVGLPEVTPSLRYNIIHRNLEVYPKEQFSCLVGKEYTSVDDPTYRFCMEDIEKPSGWVMLRCVDIPAGHRRSDGTHSTTYDRVDNDSDVNSSSPRGRRPRTVNSPVNNVPSTGQTSRLDPDITRRPPMKTPEPSSSSTDEDDGGDTYPTTGSELMMVIKNRIQSKDNRGLMATIPKSDDFTPGTRGKQLKGKTQQRTKSVPPAKVAESSSDEDYDYTSINDLARPLNEAKPNGAARLRLSTLAPECFQSIKAKVFDSVNDPLGLGSQFEFKTYLSSEAFFAQFTETFYSWSQRFDRSLQDPIINVHKAAVCCTMVSPAPNCQYKSNIEFLPVVPVPHWPDVAREWKTRKRTSVLDKRTNINYKWPRPTQVETIVNQGCHLTTEGGKIRGRFSPSSKLEWQLSFGVAQETLLSSLSEPHLRALLWARLIFRHVVASMGVLSAQHIETIFLWLVEENYIDWQETSLGEKIMSIFQTLYACVKRRKLPHFFIQRNLLDTKAPPDLNKAQEKLYRLMENFVPLTLKTAKQLQTSNTTFPMPDLARLWEIATTPLTLVSINPALASSRTLSIDSLNEIKKNKAKKKSVEEKEGFWDSVTKTSQQQQPAVDKIQNSLRQERAKFDAEEREKRLVATTENDNVYAKIGHFNISQTKLLLEFFIKQFIAMAQSSNRIRTYSKTTVFLDQAYNLAVLLGEEGYEDTAADYHKEIESLRAASYRGLFVESVVDIPGTPCVFLTGVKDIRSNTDSSMSSASIRPSAPLPRTPIEMASKPAKANGHVDKWLPSDISNESNYLTGMRSVNRLKTKSPNGTVVMSTSATVEPIVTSQRDPSPPSVPRTIQLTDEIVVEEDESTDF